MKKVLQWFLVLALCACPLAQAAWDADKLMDKFLQAGLDALEGEQQRRQQAKAAAQASPADAPATAADDRTPEERAKSMLAVFLDHAMTPGTDPVAARVAHTLKDSADILLQEYKEEYKEEGRAYARELGDIIVARVQEDPKIQSSIHSIQALCWGVIVYLTLVTLVMLISLLHLRRINSRLLRSVQDLQKRLLP
ncbi:MAG: hypothetical protein IKV82_07670 [Akkermansia sp.]|nr:hypothetical protein [Akkermansia sp.]